MFKLSNVIGHHTWGGPVGTGSLILSSGKWAWQYVPEYKLEMSGGKRKKLHKYYYKELHFMKDEFGWESSSDWYLKYE